MSVTRKSLTAAAVGIAALAVTGTAVGATHYVITSLSQISPSVVKQLPKAPLVISSTIPTFSRK